LSFSILFAPMSGSAQVAPPRPPPPQGYPPPPQGYGQQPPQGYGQQPPPYYAPPPGAYPQQSLAPAKLRYQDGVAPPAGYHIEEHPRKGLVVAGAVVLGTTYFISATIGLSSSNPDDRWLVVPIFGPFIDMGARGNHSCNTDTVSGNIDCNVFEPVIRFYLAFDGIAQTAGGVLLLTGFLFPKKEFVSDTYYGFHGKGPQIASWTLLPQVTPGSRYGLTLMGELF
jgi:hypothetical protein